MGGEDHRFRLMGDIPEETSDARPVPRRRFSLVSLRNTVARNAVEPVASLKRARFSKRSSGKLLGFVLKIAAVELVRRGSLAFCPQLWRGIQGFSLLQLPPLAWLHHWVPLPSFLVRGSQVFSKPVLFLSLATTTTGRLDEMRAAVDHTLVEEQSTFCDERMTEDIGAVDTLAPVNIEREHVDANGWVYRTKNLQLLKENLERARVKLPERMTDDELERFLVAVNGNVQRSAMFIRRSIQWRDTFHFLSPYELESWSILVFWHGYDIRKRPSLVVRIGWAYSILKAHERPRFAQAVLSQVEYGVSNLLQDEDPRITVIIDCEGTPALGFPVHMLKSCCGLVQENYPTRLAALFVVNLPPVVRVIAQAICKVLKPATRKKIHVEGDQHASALAEHHGGAASLPNFLGGSCNCSNCQKAVSITRSTRLQFFTKEQICDGTDDEVGLEESYREQECNSYHRYNWVLRAIIVGFLMLWVIVGLLAGLFDPEKDFIPT